MPIKTPVPSAKRSVRSHYEACNVRSCHWAYRTVTPLIAQLNICLENLQHHRCGAMLLISCTMNICHIAIKNVPTKKPTKSSQKFEP